MFPEHVLSKSNTAVRSLFADLAAAESVTLVLGAGVSVDAGLPSWRGLLVNLLEDAFRTAQFTQEITRSLKYADLTEAVMSDSDLMSSATYASIITGAQREKYINTALYLGHPFAPGPGRLAKSVASLIVMLSGKVRVLTTNYDLLVEDALTELVPDGLRVESFAPSDIDDAVIERVVDLGDGGWVPVVHLHGIATFAGESRDLVLDQRDFALSKARPTGQLLPTLLRGVVVFIGCSMTDPNLLAASYQSQVHDQGNRPVVRSRYTLLVDDVGLDSVGRDNESIRQCIGGLAWDRIEDMGIHPIWLISYGQISQVLIESAIALGTPNYWDDVSAARYGLRLTRWRSELTRASHFSAQFESVQRTIHSALYDTLKEMRESGEISPKPGEELGLHLWVRAPGKRLGRLELWGTSTSTHREAWSLTSQGVTIEAGTGVLAVDAAFNCAPQVRKSSTDGSRWQASIALPLTLSEEPWNSLPVGVLTISSTEAGRRSFLTRLGSSQKDSLYGRLHALGGQLLDPASWLGDAPLFGQRRTATAGESG